MSTQPPTVPLVEGAVAVEFVVDEVVVDSIPIAAAAPGIADVSVAEVDDEVIVAWSHGDAEAPDGATYTVRWSADVETWIPVAVDIPGTEPDGDHSTAELHLEVVA